MFARSSWSRGVFERAAAPASQPVGGCKGNLTRTAGTTTVIVDIKELVPDMVNRLPSASRRKSVPITKHNLRVAIIAICICKVELLDKARNIIIINIHTYSSDVIHFFVE